MQTPWNFLDAKSNLSELLDRAEQEPPCITRGDRHYVVLDGDEYRRLTDNGPSLKELILQGPNLDGVDLGRDRSGSPEME